MKTFIVKFSSENHTYYVRQKMGGYVVAGLCRRVFEVTTGLRLHPGECMEVRLMPIKSRTRKRKLKLKREET